MKNNDVLQALQKRHRRSLWLPVLLVAGAGAICAALALILLATPGASWKPEPAKLQAWLGVSGIFLRRGRPGSLAAPAFAGKYGVGLGSRDPWEKLVSKLQPNWPRMKRRSPARNAKNPGNIWRVQAGSAAPGLFPRLAAVVALLCLAQLLLVGVWVADLALHGWPKRGRCGGKPPQASSSG